MNPHSQHFALDWFPKSIKGAVVLCLSIVAALMFIEVWLRYILHIPLLWIEEVIVIPTIWLYLLGAAYGSYERTHIKVDLVEVYVVNQKAKLIVKIIVTLITLIIALFFVQWAYHFLVWDIIKGQSSYIFRIPLYWSRSSILVGAVIIVVYTLTELIGLIQQHFEKAAISSSGKNMA